MIDPTRPRVITARRTLTMTTAATTVAVGVSAAAGPYDIGSGTPVDAHVVLAQAAVADAASGEGEDSGEVEGEGAVSGEGPASGEGEGGSAGDRVQGLQRDMSFMEGHMRAGLKLYEAGDLAAARTHMGHPIEEKYGAVADPLADRGFERLRRQIQAVAAAAEAGAPFADVERAFDTARETMVEIRGTMSPRDQMLGLAALVRVAADEYAVAVEGGEITNLHEYQDSWGFLRTVGFELRRLSAGADAGASDAGDEALGHLAATDAAFGDIQGQGEMTLDPGILYGAAARIELAALELD